jgi:DNA-binding HxlR family transcriptional regulator
VIAELELPIQRNVLSQRCVSRQALQIVSHKWLALVVFALVGGAKRHADLQRMIEGISQKMLTQTLRQMEERGLIVRAVLDPEPPRHVEYRLSELGETLADPLVDLCHWAMAHAPELGLEPEAHVVPGTLSGTAGSVPSAPR